MSGKVHCASALNSVSHFRVATGNESSLVMRYSLNWCLPINSGNPSQPGPSGDSSSFTPEPSQTVSKLLLLSIFSVAARYLDERASEPTDKIWDTGCDYLTQARSVLGT